MYETALLLLFVWIAVSVLAILILVTVLIRYFIYRKKQDYIHRDDYTLDDFYVPKEH